MIEDLKYDGQNLQRLHDTDQKLNEIIRDEKLSDYEKILRVSVEVVIPLLDKIQELTNENVRAGWEREAAHADDWRKQPIEMGML